MDTPKKPPQSAPTPAASEPLLSLDTLIERPRIEIDGTAFEILSTSELSVIDSHRFGKWGRRIQELADAEGDTEEDELNGLVDRVARKVCVGVSDEAYASLSGKHKLAICDVFTGLLLRDSLGVAGAIAKAAGVPIENLSTGAKSSPGSSASTAGGRNGGWLKRLWRWFGLS